MTALKNVDFTGKTIRPFVTHEGFVGISNQIKEICKETIFEEGLIIRGSSINSGK